MIWVAIVLGALALFSLLMRGESPEDKALRRVLVGASMGGAVLFLIIACLIAIPPGHTGVQTLFGRVLERPLPEGLQIKHPFARVEKLSVRTETYTMAIGEEAIKALSRDGLMMPLEVTIAYRLVTSDAPWVFQNFSRAYVERILRPAARTAVREATAEFNSTEAYAEKRDELANRMGEFLKARIADLLSEYENFSGVGLEVRQVMLRNVSLPDRVKAAIEEKLAAEQDALRMEFVLQREEKEAERKRIEARGIRDFQVTVTEGISEQLIRWKGIEATEKIATSSNAKVIIASGDGIPVILGGN